MHGTMNIKFVIFVSVLVEHTQLSDTILKESTDILK